MKQLILNPVLASSIATCALFSAMPAAPLDGAERAALVSQADASLLELRAGAPADTVPIGGSERESLARAQASDPDLLLQRAGNLSGDEWMIIAIVVSTVLLVLLLT